jgi:hypothetical protein
MERTKIIYLPAYKDWFDIIKQDGNRVLIDFYGKSIVYNILGVQGIQII